MQKKNNWYKIEIFAKMEDDKEGKYTAEMLAEVFDAMCHKELKIKQFLTMSGKACSYDADLMQFLADEVDTKDIRH